MRNGGDVRGNSENRRARKWFLLKRDGTGVKAPCCECGTIVTYLTMCVDRIIPGHQGGRYTRDNIQIHCRPCSNQQGQQIRADKRRAK